MTAVFENPWIILGIGIVVQAVLGFVYLSTSRSGVLVAMGGVLVLMGLGVLVERIVVTPREEVVYTLDEVAAALENNDLPGVLSHLASNADELRDRVSSVMPQYTITAVRVTGVKVTINRLTDPITARAEFTARINARSKHGMNPYENYLRRIVVNLRREGDRWLLVEHDEQELSAGY